MGEFVKKIFTILCVIALILAFDISFSSKDTIIIYSSMEQYRGEELQHQLNKKFPDKNVLVMYVSTAKSAAKIKTEKSKSDADIVVGLETSYMEKVKGSLSDLSNMKTLDYLDEFKLSENDNKYITWEKQAGAFIVNTKVLDKYDLPMPTSYEDLLKPEYKNLIAMPDPKTSGTGYFFYKSLVNARGEKEALEYFDKLHANVKSFTESGSGPVKLLIQNEIAVGLGLTFQAVEEQNAGSPFEIVYPKEGSPFSLTGAGIVKGKEENKDVREIFEFIANDFMRYDKEYFSPEKVLRNQTNKIENYPTEVVYANMEGISDIKEKERLLGLWKY